MSAMIIDEVTAANRIAELERELGDLRLRVEVTRLVAQDVSRYVDDRVEAIDLVVDDVIARWRVRSPNDPQCIGGHGGFWHCYASRVEYAPPGSNNEYREAICPDTDALDGDDYYERAWTTHVTDLRCGREPACFQ